MILGLQQGLKADGIEVSLVKLCEWFGVDRRTVYYRATKGQPKLQEQFVKPIKAMIEENPSFGYRTVASLLDFNKNTVQRVFQLMGWQVRKRPVASGPAFRRCRLWPKLLTSAGQRTCAGFGLAKMAGRIWRWSLIATPENCWVGTSAAVADPKRQRQRWSRP